MPENPASIPWELFAVGLLAGGACMSLMGNLVEQLQRRHKDEYEAIGSPRSDWPFWWDDQWKIFRFTFSKRPRELGDKKLLRLAMLLRLVGPTMVVYTVGLVIWGCMRR